MSDNMTTETQPKPRIASWEYHPETEMPIALCAADADILTATADEDDSPFIDISLADTRRIQAAWNAVEAAGISTTALEQGVISDLLAACRAALEMRASLSEASNTFGIWSERIAAANRANELSEQIRTAINKAAVR